MQRRKARRQVRLLRHRQLPILPPLRLGRDQSRFRQALRAGRGCHDALLSSGYNFFAIPDGSFSRLIPIKALTEATV
ncbi:hypothetical protein HOE425_320080 [Hoeflea sp. EC-HK425]|nr:hypothetical protein HOE425_320080 [Hoeflea sp. EC-HK425]